MRIVAIGLQALVAIALAGAAFTASAAPGYHDGQARYHHHHHRHHHHHHRVAQGR